MNAHAREIVQLAQQLGFTVDGYDGNGHVRLTHPNGCTTSIAATPSEYRGRRNAIALLERLSGRKLPRPNHRKSHKANQRSGFSIDTARRECASWHADNDEHISELVQQRDELIERARAAAQRRATLRTIPPLLTRISDIEARLRDLRMPFDPFDPYTLRS